MPASARPRQTRWPATSPADPGPVCLSFLLCNCPSTPRPGHRGSPAVSALTDGAGTRHRGKTMVGPASGGSHAGAWAWGSCPLPPETDDWALQSPQLRILSSRSPATGSLHGRGQGSSAGPKAHTTGHCVTTEPERSHRHPWGQLSPECTYRTPRGAASWAVYTARQGPRWPSGPASRCWCSPLRTAPGDGTPAEPCTVHPTGQSPQGWPHPTLGAQVHRPTTPPTLPAGPSPGAGSG